MNKKGVGEEGEGGSGYERRVLGGGEVWNKKEESGVWFFFFQAEDGIRDLVRSRGLGDMYMRQMCVCVCVCVCAHTHTT